MICFEIARCSTSLFPKHEFRPPKKRHLELRRVDILIQRGLKWGFRQISAKYETFVFVGPRFGHFCSSEECFAPYGDHPSPTTQHQAAREGRSRGSPKVSKSSENAPKSRISWCLQIWKWSPFSLTPPVRKQSACSTSAQPPWKQGGRIRIE